MSAFNMEKEAWLAWQADRHLWPDDDDLAEVAREAAWRRRHGKPDTENEPEEDEQP